MVISNKLLKMLSPFKCIQGFILKNIFGTSINAKEKPKTFFIPQRCVQIILKSRFLCVLLCEEERKQVFKNYFNPSVPGVHEKVTYT